MNDPNTRTAYEAGALKLPAATNSPSARAAGVDPRRRVRPGTGNGGKRRLDAVDETSIAIAAISSAREAESEWGRLLRSNRPGGNETNKYSLRRHYTEHATLPRRQASHRIFQI